MYTKVISQNCDHKDVTPTMILCAGPRNMSGPTFSQAVLQHRLSKPLFLELKPKMRLPEMLLTIHHGKGNVSSFHLYFSSQRRLANHLTKKKNKNKKNCTITWLFMFLAYLTLSKHSQIVAITFVSTTSVLQMSIMAKWIDGTAES